MFQILSYSGICTKTRAMSGKLLSPGQYERLASCASVGEALSVLKHFPAYQAILKDFDETTSHRGMIEATLTHSLYRDFNRLYRFANPKQRRFLDLYRLHFQVSFLKECLRSAYSGSEYVSKPAFYREFFERGLGLPFDALASSTSIDAFLRALEGTCFYAPLKRIHDSAFHSLFDYENGFDQFYFCFFWKEKDRVLAGKELELLTDNYGKEIDLLNLQWIVRAKRFYRMTPAELYAMIIPCRYRLTPKEISAMVETSSLEETMVALSDTYYGRKYRSMLDETFSPEQLYLKVLTHIYELSGRKNPYSLAPVNAYLFNKEQEIGRITSVIEGIRYGLSGRELISSMTGTASRSLSSD